MPTVPPTASAISAPRVIVTRPAEQAGQWLAHLQAAGLQAVALPLIEIGPVADAAPLRAAWQAWGQWDACMFVSANAVRYFFEQKPQFAIVSIDKFAINNVVNTAQKNALNCSPRYWATGPGTVGALQQAGCESALIDAPDAAAAQWDSEALWQRVARQIRPGSRVLIVRGADTQGPSASRDYLAAQVAARGGLAHCVNAYARCRPNLTPQQLAQCASAAHDGSIWVFTSSQAVAHLPALDWQHARCVVTHPRIAAAAQRAGFAVVCTSRPALEDVVRSIESLS